MKCVKCHNASVNDIHHFSWISAKWKQVEVLCVTRPSAGVVEVPGAGCTRLAISLILGLRLHSYELNGIAGMCKKKRKRKKKRSYSIDVQH